jgi:hypothetical protein
MILTNLNAALDGINLEIEHMELNDHAYTKDYRRLIKARKSIRKAIDRLVVTEVK